MISTGVVRRIDDLGRIVIPKEVRKNLKIRENDDLEIYFDGENIVLKKVSSLKDINEILRIIVDSIYSIFKVKVVVTDKSKIIISDGNRLLNHEFSNDILRMFTEKKLVIEKNIVDLNIIGTELIKVSYVFEPIFSNGNIIGSILIYSDKPITDFHKNLSRIISLFCSKYLED